MHGVNFDIPPQWLPNVEVVGHPEWFKCDSVALAFIRHLGVEADFYWIIESDVCGPVDRWKALFADPVCGSADGLFVCPRTKSETLWNPWWHGPHADEKSTHMHIQSIYGISSRAVGWLTDAAEDRRNIFCELVTASVIVANGGSIGTINKNTTHCNSQTIKAHEDRVIFNKRLLNHPVKKDSYGVDGLF